MRCGYNYHKTHLAEVEKPHYALLPSPGSKWKQTTKTHKTNHPYLLHQKYQPPIFHRH